jgi:N-methylhydantoinase A
VELAEYLNIPQVVIPAYPGIASAFGMMSADVRHDYVKTHICDSDEAGVDHLEALFADMERQGSQQLKREGFSGSAAVLLRYADMRYLRQAYELSVHLPDKQVTREAVTRLINGFHKNHKTAYGYTREKEPVEFVNLRVVALGKLPAIRVSDERPAGSKPPEPSGHRHVVFGGVSMSTSIYRRDLLLQGQRVLGPAVVEQLDSTIVIPPRYDAVTDHYGNLHVTLKYS